MPILFFLIAAVVVFFVVDAYEPNRTRALKKQWKQKISPLRPGAVKPETRNLLYCMCGGDRDLAHRLASGSHGTEQERWKNAIYYLERDRR